MPRDVNGNVTLPTNDSSPAVPRNVIRSSDFNELMGDISTMMQDSLSRSGKGGMTADLDMDGNDVLNAPLIDTAISKSNSAFARLKTTNFVYAIADLASLDVTDNTIAFLLLGARSGEFTLRLVSSLSTEETAARAADTYQAIFVNSTDDALYVWVRDYTGAIQGAWGGIDPASSDCSAQFQAMINISWKLAPLFRGAARLDLPAGVIRAANLLYNPTPDAVGDLTAFTMHGLGKDVTVIQRPVASSDDVLTINTSAPTAFFGTIDIGYMTIDGYNSVAEGLVLNEVWYSDFPSLRIINCRRPCDAMTVIYANFDKFDFAHNGEPFTIDKLATPSFPGAVPAVINFTDGLMRFNNSTHLTMDWVNSVNIINCGFEVGNQLNTAIPGAIKVGANCDRLGRVSTVLNVKNGWMEECHGTSYVELNSGHNVLEGVRFWEPGGDATNTIDIVGGRYSLRDLTSSTNKAPNIIERAGAVAGNLIVNCPTLVATVDFAKTGTDSGPSIVRKFMTVGGAGTTGGSLVIQNTTTFWQLMQAVADLTVSIGSTEYLRVLSDGRFLIKEGGVSIKDGITAPGAVVGQAHLYVDSADGDLKIRFGDGITKTIVTDT